MKSRERKPVKKCKSIVLITALILSLVAAACGRPAQKAPSETLHETAENAGTIEEIGTDTASPAGISEGAGTDTEFPAAIAGQQSLKKPETTRYSRQEILKKWPQ